MGRRKKEMPPWVMALNKWANDLAPRHILTLASSTSDAIQVAYKFMPENPTP